MEYVPAGDGPAHDMWSWHVSLLVAAARPVGHVPVRGGSLPSPGALSGAPGEVSPSAVTPRKMLFAEDKAALGAAADASASDDVDRTLHLEKQVGLGDAANALDAAAATRNVWARCAAAAEEGGRETFSPDAARSARRRGEALSDALVGVAPPCLAAVVSVVAGDVVAAAAKTREALAGVRGDGSVGAKEAKSLWPALARAACGLGLLRAVAARAAARLESDAAAFADAFDSPERAAFEDALRLTWNASDAWTPALPDVATQAYSSDYGDDGVLTDDDGVAAASRAAEAAAALAALRLRVAPPSTTAALDAAAAALTHALPRAREEWRAFANVVLEATNVVVVAAGALEKIEKTRARLLRGDRGDVCFGDGPPLTQSVADEAVVRLAEASRVASRDVQTRARARERDAAETDAWTREIEEDTPLAILAGARQAGALATAACAELLARTPERAAAAAAASALQAAGTALAAEEASEERRGGEGEAEAAEGRTFLALRAAPTRILDAAVAALGAERGGLVAAAALVSMRLSPSLTSSASAHRALRAVAGAAAGPEITAAAAAAADAADAAASGEDLALAAEARRGAAAAATSAFVDPARPEAASRVEATAEGVFELARARSRAWRASTSTKRKGRMKPRRLKKPKKTRRLKKPKKPKKPRAWADASGWQRRRRRSLPSPRVRGDASRSPPPPRWRR